MATEEAMLFERLSAFLRERLGSDEVEIIGLRRASQGLSRENWPFDIAWRDRCGVMHREQLLLRRDPTGGLLDTDRRVEFGLLEALAGVAALPTPEVLWLDPDGASFGRPSLIMRRLDGAGDNFILRERPSGPLAAERLALAKRFMDLLIEIHGVDWRGLGLDRWIDPHPPGAVVAAALDHWEGEMRRFMVEPMPELEYVLAWLRAHAPQAEHAVFVHGDFKPGNLLFDKGAVVAVLDWETAHIGDPIEDLGWVTNPMRASEHQIPGFWERDEMIAYYQRRTGRNVSADALTWWNVFANFKLSVIAMTGLNAALAGKADRLFPGQIFGLGSMLDQMGIAP